MSFSPDFSSVSANNWAVPTAASPTPADFPAQANAVPGDSTPALDTYLPSAPLLQQPEQDVYGNPLPPQTEGLSDTYTPSFAQPDATTAQTAPPITGHPLQTALATGVGALGGGTIGGVVKNTFFNEDEAPKKEGTPSKKKPASVGSDWAFNGTHSDDKTPKVLIDNKNKRYYEITEDKAITPFHLSDDGSRGNPIDKSTVNNELLQDVVLGTPKVQKEKWSDFLFADLESSDPALLLTRQDPNVLEIKLGYQNKESSKNLQETFRALVNQTNKVAVQLDAEGKIIGLYQISDTKVTNTQNLSEEEIKKLLTSFPNTVLSKEMKDDLLAKLSRKFSFWKPDTSSNAFDKLKAETQQLLREVSSFGTSASGGGNGVITKYTDLLSKSQFKPEETITKPPLKGMDYLGEYALPVGLGVVVGAGALFGLDYWLQHRTPKKSTEAELA